MKVLGWLSLPMPSHRDRRRGTLNESGKSSQRCQPVGRGGLWAAREKNPDEQSNPTRLLHFGGAGPFAAQDQVNHLPTYEDPNARLMEVLYEELRALARARMSKLPPGLTLQATALVHEAFLRITPKNDLGDRSHYFYAAARAMRDILVEAARRKSSAKRGGECLRVVLDEGCASIEADVDRTLALNELLEKLEAQLPEHAQLVEMRHFGGLNNKEVAEMTGWSLATVERRWRYARAWLRRELDPSSVEVRPVSVEARPVSA